MALGRDAASFKIEADATPALREFGFMVRSYRESLREMRGENASFRHDTSKSLVHIRKKANKQSSLIGSGFKKGFALAKSAVKIFSATMVRELARSTYRAIASVTQLTSNFETGLAEISTLLDDDMMPAMDGFEKALVQISITGDQTLGTLTKALYQTISAGITGAKEAIDVVKVADVAATAGLTKTSTAVSGLTTIMNAYSGEAGTATEISDVLFQTVRKGVTTFPELSKNIGKVAGIAAQSGVKFKETAAALVALTKAGLNTPQATTALKNTIKSILKPSKQASEAFKALGIQYGETALKSKGLIGVMHDIQRVSGGSSEVIAKLFPNIRAMSGAMVLAGKGADNFKVALDDMKASAGATGDAYEKMQDTWGFVTAQLKNIISSFITEGSGPLFKTLKDTVIAIKEYMLSNKDQFIGFGKTISRTLSEIVKAILGAMTIIKKLAKVARVVLGVATLGMTELAAVALRALAKIGEKQIAIGKRAATAREKRRKLEDSVTRIMIKGGEMAIKLEARLGVLRKRQYLAQRGRLKLTKEETAQFKLLSAAMARASSARAQVAKATASKGSGKEAAEKLRKAKIKLKGTGEQDALDSELMGSSIKKIKESLAFRKQTAAEEDKLIDLAVARADRFAKKKRELDEKRHKEATKAKVLVIGRKAILDEESNFWASFISIAESGTANLAKTLGDGLGTFISGLSDIWGSFWANMASGPKYAAKEIIPAMLDLVGGIALSWAGFYAAMVPGLIATFQWPQAAAAAAAAIALGAVGGLAKGGASMIREANKPATQSVPSGASSNGGTNRQRAVGNGGAGANQGPTTINLHFGFMAPPSRRQQEQVAAHVANSLSASRNNSRVRASGISLERFG